MCKENIANIEEAVSSLWLNKNSLFEIFSQKD